MDDVCIDSAASRLKQADLYASLSRMGYDLESGWSAVVSIRRAGNSAGTKDTYYWSPQGKRFRSKKEVAAFLGLVAGGKVRDLEVVDIKGAKRDPDPLYRPFKRHHSERSLQDLGSLSDGGRPWKRQCRSILNALMAHRHSWPFLCPVKKTEAPGYYEVIKNPMDMSTVMARLDSDVYQSPEEFAHDANLIWSNAKTYNDPQDGIYEMAEELEAVFDRLWEERLGMGEEATGGLPPPLADAPPLFVGAPAAWAGAAGALQLQIPLPLLPLPLSLPLPVAPVAAPLAHAAPAPAHLPAAASRRCDEEDGGCAFTNMLDTLALIAAAEMPSPRAGGGKGELAQQGSGGGHAQQRWQEEEEEEEGEEEDEGDEEQQQEEEEEEEEEEEDEGSVEEAAERCHDQGPAAAEAPQGQQRGQEQQGAACGSADSMEVDRSGQRQQPQQQQQQQQEQQEEGAQAQQQREAAAAALLAAALKSEAASYEGDCAAEVVRAPAGPQHAKHEAAARGGGAREPLGTPEARPSAAATPAAPAPDAPRGAGADQLAAHPQQAIAGA
ncbi:transcription factor [Raphidocelis subcapitata]|uniref:Transcription factor n=1 Tax=Raphidocelis subcapitata TaxID=307507 RepID=A0A2V0P9Z9_9CHLO|nr:transcription factor [Raphidocelis subcapitata]|eukprot:GBF96671.1 transcription factor [Raphidocelis subcapitata]